MPLTHASIFGWALNRIHRRGEYHVELTGPYQMPQVVDSAGTVALSGPGGAVFCATVAQAEELCRMANAGALN